MSTKTQKAEFLLSTDSLSWYWLDLIFQVAKDVWFDWLDLALRKNFDAWNVSYVEKLVEKYWLPVRVIQVSSSVNAREMNQAIDIAAALWVEVISINAPYIYDIKTYKYLSNNLAWFKKHNRQLKFAIINPLRSSILILPISKYHFTNIVEIINKYKSYLGLDIANLEETALEVNFLRKIANFIPHIPVVYISDKSKIWNWHIPLWDWVLKLPKVFKKFKQHEYYGNFSLKLDLPKKDLADLEKVELILRKCKVYYKENFEDLIIK